MPRYSSLRADLSADDLEQRYRHAHDPVARTHWHLLWLIGQGRRVADAAQIVGYSANWARELVRRDNAQGPAGIGDRRLSNPGQQPLLNAAQRAALRTALAEPPPDGGLWTGPTVAAWMRERLDRPIHPQRGWDALRTLGFTPQRPRPRAARADATVQAAFKKGGSTA